MKTSCMQNHTLFTTSTLGGAERYRFGFNGKENINEVSGWQDYGERFYNTNLARFFSPDPIIVCQQQYPELSTYQFASNSPIRYIDLDGLEGTEPENDNFKPKLDLPEPQPQDNIRPIFPIIELPTIPCYPTPKQLTWREKTKNLLDDVGNKLKGNYNSWKTRMATEWEQYWANDKRQKVIRLFSELFGNNAGEPENQNTVTLPNTLSPNTEQNNSTNQVGNSDNIQKDRFQQGAEKLQNSSKLIDTVYKNEKGDTIKGYHHDGMPKNTYEDKINNSDREAWE